MKRFFTTGLLFGATLLLSPSVFAGQITNLDVTPTGKQILIEWDKLTDSEMFDENGGYVLQYSTIQNDIRNNKSYKNQVKKSVDTITLRAAGFEKDETYYFRVYSLHTDGRLKKLNNGSKILKWKWASNGDVSSEFVAANDPVIVDNSSSSDITFNFGKLRAEKFDTSAHMKWSTPSLSSSEYDGFTLILSTNDDLSSPLAKVVVPKTMKTMFFEGLSPETQYYSAGYFKKGTTLFGKSDTITFTTMAEFTARQKNTYERRVLKRGNLGIRHNLSGESSSNTSASTSTTTSTRSSNTTTTTSTAARITELKALIKKYQAELRSLQKSSTTTARSSSRTSRTSRSSSSTTTTATTSSSSRLQAIRDFLRNRKNNK